MLTWALCLASSIAAPVPKDAEQFEKAVSVARKGAIEYLKDKQNKDGNWESAVFNLLAEMEGGQTALVTLALLESGLPFNDPTITKAVEYLVKLPPKKTYVVSLQMQALARVDSKKYKEQIQKNADWLIEKAIKNNNALDGWSYPGNQFADCSNTHFAVMGLHIAAKAGAKVDEKIWKQIEEFYLRTQRDEGWPYYPHLPAAQERATRSMTTCALIGLLVASKHDQNAKGPNKAFEKGLKTLMSWDLLSPKSNGYALMTVAELGRLHGSNEFKLGNEKWNWYQTGVETLMKLQKEDGSIVYSANGLDSYPILTTAFGLYFLGPPAKK
ncbi:MAG TPA: hypothetical protein VG097_18000 [Gemmata sp.]|jgi:hypothetical protein|nr:hypothetical protein [Gemmata sp.]